MEEIILKLTSIVISLFGLFMFFRPKIIAERLKSFYRTYPFTRYASDEQLTSRLIYIRLVAIAIIVVGVICFFQ